MRGHVGLPPNAPLLLLIFHLKVTLDIHLKIAVLAAPPGETISTKNVWMPVIRFARAWSRPEPPTAASLPVTGEYAVMCMNSALSDAQKT